MNAEKLPAVRGKVPRPGPAGRKQRVTVTPELNARIVELRASGATIKATAAATGVAEMTVIRRSRAADPEVIAINFVLAALSPLSDDSRRRVVAYVTDRLRSGEIEGGAG